LSVMQGFINFLQINTTIVISAFLVSCGGLAPKNQSANLPPNQNTNLAIVIPKQSPTHLPTIEVENTPPPTPDIANISQNNNLSNNSENLPTSDKLIIPVAGVGREDLQDTFRDARSQGRVHDAIDIIAPKGTPVIAASDGEIARFFDSERGGVTIYQFSRDKKLVYYYAHLDRRAENLREHDFVRQGTIIGYVGDTGNAVPGNYHLHFAVWIVSDPKRFWEGANINPYSLLQ